MKNSHNDWAYLEKFRLENDLLKAHFDEHRIVFIGDSIIAGLNQYSLFREHPHFINRGINGQTSTQILQRFATDVIDLNPRKVVILVGTNDVAENGGSVTLEQIQDNFSAMLDLAKANAIQVIFCSILPVSAYYWNKKITTFDRIDILNAFLAVLGKNENANYIDFYSEFSVEKKINPTFFHDGVHPNGKGYKVMSTIFLNHLTE